MRTSWQILCVAGLLQASCRGQTASTLSEPDGPRARPSGSADTPLDASVRPLGSYGAAPDANQLCRTDRDCPADQTCCPSGLVGICKELEPGRACPAPDLTWAKASDLGLHFDERFFYEDDCLLQKCVSSRGARRLMSFSVNLINRGDGHMILGGQGAPGVRRVACDGSLFVDDFLRYELIDSEGTRRAGGSGDIGYACRVGAGAQSTSPFDCEILGLEAHSLRSYPSSADCQWVDITTVPAGEYTLRVSANPNGRLTDNDPSNDTLELPVTIPGRNPLAPCEEETPLEIDSFGEGVECGWSLLAGQTAVPCTPGEFVSLDCTFCGGAYLPRACPGSDPCSSAGSLRYNSIGTRPDACSSSLRCAELAECTDFGFDCPAAGLYTLLGFPVLPLNASDNAVPTAPSQLLCERVAESSAR